jgi:hypothetical protein
LCSSNKSKVGADPALPDFRPVAQDVFTRHNQGVSHGQWPKDDPKRAPIQTGSIIWYTLKAVDIERRPQRAEGLSKRAKKL